MTAQDLKLAGQLGRTVLLDMRHDGPLSQRSDGDRKATVVAASFHLQVDQTTETLQPTLNEIQVQLQGLPLEGHKFWVSWRFCVKEVLE